MYGTIQLDARSTAPAQGRRWISGVLIGLGKDALVEDAQLVASELIANAVLHGRGPITLSLAASEGGVALEVRDRGGTDAFDPGAPMPAQDSSGGRGLPIVRALASAVEVDTRDGDTRVRAVLGTPRGRAVAS